MRSLAAIVVVILSIGLLIVMVNLIGISGEDFMGSLTTHQIIALGDTITHHHAVGKDHQSHYDEQKSQVFDRSLKAIKKELDPAWILNPEVLVNKQI